jgi:DNA repair exonuclease SbcCD ATPase subunit
MSDSKQYIGEVKIRAEMEDKISQGIKEITNDTKNLKETLEATNKALQELAGTNIKPKVDDSELDKLDKKVKKKRKISVDTDVSSTAEKKIDDLDKKIKKKSKKSTTKTKSSKKTADDKDQLDGINADKVVRSTRYGKNGKSSTSHSYTKSNGVQQNYNDKGELKSETATVVDLRKAYSQLNKDITEYYSLKTKSAKGKVATGDQAYVKGRISDLRDEMTQIRTNISDARKLGFYNDELEQKSLAHFQRKSNGYNSYRKENDNTIKAYGNDDNTAIRQGLRTKQLNNYSGQSTEAIERARTLDSTITSLEKELSDLVNSGASMDQITAKFDECTSAGQEFKNVMTLVNSTMEKTSKNSSSAVDKTAKKTQESLEKKVAQVKELVSDASIQQLDAKFEKIRSKYAGQKGSENILDSFDAAVKTIHEKQNSIKTELSKRSDSNLTQIAADADILNSKLSEVETTAKTLGDSLSKNLDSTSLQKTIDKIDKLVQSSDGFASKSQLDKLDELRTAYTSKDSGITKAVDYDNSKTIANIEQEINARKKLAEVQKELATGKYSATEAGYKNDLSKYEGQTSESLTRARENLKQFKEIREDFEKSMKDTKVSDLSDEEVERLSKNLQKMTEEEEKYKTAIKQVKAEETATLAPGVALRASNEMQSYINNNSKAWKKYKAQLEEVRDAYKNVTTEGQKLEVDAKARDLKAKISAEGLTGASFWQDTKRAVNQIAQFTGIYGMLQNVVMEIPSKVVSNVKEINDAQIELAKVASDASESQLSQYWDQAAESAKKYGATVSDVISSTADWSKLGWSLDDAKKLSDVTTLYQRVGDNMTQESASESLVSTLQGFNMQADEAESIVDKFNEVNIAASICSNVYALCA